ncbi:MAG: DUF2779 domain-containing protein [Rhodanobacteraceae bacterium]|nr:DUF2779 domain-containing protein [Rhodanobacteraceae bacterium]
MAGTSATTPRLSKSRVQSGRQCHKRLWLELHRRDAAQWSEAAQAVLDAGTQFGELARELLGGGVLIEADHLHVDDALAETAAALALPRRQAPRLFEAAFSHRGVRVRVDALERGRRGDTLVEVKSTASVKDEHLWDCAIQTWVARGAGRAIAKVVLAHVDTAFVYQTPGDYRGLLHRVDITAEVEARLPEIPRLVAELKRVAAGPMPAIATGAHCAQPYDCPFFEHCRAAEPPGPEYPVDLLPHAVGVIARLLAAGYTDLRKVPTSALPPGRLQRIARVTRTGRAHVSPKLPRLLAAIAYPRYYLDFETVSFVVPRWPGTRPFQPVPFQFSCHVEQRPGELAHADFLDLSGASPLRAFAECLLATLGTHGPVLVWNRGFEAAPLRDLAALFPDLADALLGVAERLLDLLPLYRAHYYHRDMRGSWSIKRVLPTVAPELAYDELAIGDGNAAQAGYLEAIDAATPPQRRAALHAELSAYCRRDTEAMLRLMTPPAPRRAPRAAGASPPA